MTIYFLKCAILKEPLLVERMQMTHQWNDESQKPLLFALSEDQRKDHGGGGGRRDRTLYATVWLSLNCCFPWRAKGTFAVW